MDEDVVEFDAASWRAASGEAPMTEREVVSRAYEAHRDWLYRHLVLLGADPQAAEDLTQDVFLKLYVAVRQGQRIQNVRGWLVTVSTNQWLNQRRAEGYRPTLSGEEAAAWFDRRADSAANPEAALLQREQALALQAAIHRLTPQQQICLNLRAEGLRYREIARIIGVSIPTVVARLTRAIEEIKHAIQV